MPTVVRSDANGNVVLPARAVLAGLPEQLRSRHGELGLRHPLGTYNTSVAVVAKRVTRVISLLRAVVPETGSGHTESSEQVDALLESQEALLQGLMQHMDDCINILRGFTVDRRDFDKSRHVKVYRRAVDQYRSHIGKVAGRIKHRQGRLTLLTARLGASSFAGYFVASMFSPVNRSRVAKAFTAASRVSTVMRAQRLGTGSATSYNTRVSGPRRRSGRQTRHPDRRTNSTLTCGPPVCQSPTLPPWPSAQRAHGGMGKSPLSCFTGRPSRFQMSDPQPRHTIISRSYYVCGGRVRTGEPALGVTVRSGKGGTSAVQTARGGSGPSAATPYRPRILASLGEPSLAAR